MRSASAVVILSLLLPVAAAGQETEVVRRAYPFLDNRLEVAVVVDAPGELEVVRGSRGRLEVAARSADGFAGFGLGGHLTPRLRLTAVGSRSVQYVVVVPEQVNVRIQLPDGTSASLASNAPSASYTWGGAPPSRDVLDRPAHGMNGRSYGVDTRVFEQASLPLAPNGFHVAIAATSAPRRIDVPDLASVRSLSVRFEGSDFRVATSRPIRFENDDATRLELRVGGDPIDVVVYLPRDSRPFSLHAAGARIADSANGEPRALCGNVILQRPSEHRVWLTFRPQSGRLDCR